MLALGLDDGRVMLVDQATGEVKWAVEAHVGDITVAMSPGGKLTASVSNEDGHWKLWDAGSGALHRVGAVQTELERASA